VKKKKGLRLPGRILAGILQEQARSAHMGSANWEDDPDDWDGADDLPDNGEGFEGIDDVWEDLEEGSDPDHGYALRSSRHFLNTGLSGDLFDNDTWDADRADWEDDGEPDDWEEEDWDEEEEDGISEEEGWFLADETLRLSDSRQPAVIPPSQKGGCLSVLLLIVGGVVLLASLAGLWM